MNDKVEEKAILIGQRTMLGDLMKLIIDEFRSLPQLWHELSEDEQDSLIGRVELRCTKAVNECARILATQGASTVTATVESVTFKDGVKCVLKLTGGAGAHALADRAAQSVLVAIPTSEGNMGGERPQSDPQQAPLNLDGNALAGAIGIHGAEPGGDEQDGDEPGGDDSDSENPDG